MSLDILECKRINTRHDLVTKQLDVYGDVKINSVVHCGDSMSVHKSIYLKENLLTNVGINIGQVSMVQVTNDPYLYMGSSGNLFFRYNNTVPPVNISKSKPTRITSIPSGTLKLDLEQFDSKYIYVENDQKYVLDSKPLEIHINKYITNKQSYSKPPDGISLNFTCSNHTTRSNPFMIVTGTGFTFIDPLNDLNKVPLNFTYNMRYTNGWLVNQRILSAYYFSSKDTTAIASVYDNNKHVILNHQGIIKDMQVNFKGDFLVCLVVNGTAGKVVTHLFRENSWIEDPVELPSYHGDDSIRMSKDGKWLVILNDNPSELVYYKRRNNMWKQIHSITYTNGSLPLFEITPNGDELRFLNGDEFSVYYRGGDIFCEKSKITLPSIPLKFSACGTYTLFVFTDECCLYQCIYESSKDGHIPSMKKIYCIKGNNYIHCDLKLYGFILISQTANQKTLELWSLTNHDGLRKIAYRECNHDCKFFLSQRSEFVYVYDSVDTRVIYPLGTQLTEVLTHDINSSVIAMSEYNHASFLASSSDDGKPEIHISGL